MLLISPVNMETFAALLRIPFASVRIDDLVGNQRPPDNPAALVKVVCFKRLFLAWRYRGIRHPRREGCPKIHARKKRAWSQEPDAVWSSCLCCVLSPTVLWDWPRNLPLQTLPGTNSAPAGRWYKLPSCLLPCDQSPDNERAMFRDCRRPCRPSRCWQGATRSHRHADFDSSTVLPCQ